MPHAPAGWYEDPGAPGGTRYWTGAGWLAPGAGPAVAATDFTPQPTSFAPQPTSFTPQPTSFAPQHTSFTPQAEFRPAPDLADPQEQARQMAGQYAQPRAAEYQPAPQEDNVTWDVAGAPRTPDATGASRAYQAPWQGSAPQGYGRAGDPGAYAPSFYASQAPLPPYGSSALGRKRRSGWVKVAAVVATIVVGLGVRWGVGQVFGSDYSDDGRIEVATPASWTTYSADDPDITYAMDSGWATVPVDANSGLTGKGAKMIAMRSVSTGFTGDQAAVMLGAATFSVPGAKAGRDDFERAFANSKDAWSSSGASDISLDKMTILKSRAGDRWAIQTATFSFQGMVVTDYMALAMIDGYAVILQLIVPNGAAMTQSDLLAVVNSIASR